MFGAIGIATQAQYGTTQNCLLFLTDYHSEDISFVFKARSSACYNLIALNSGSAVVSFLLCVGTAYMFVKSLVKPKKVSLILFVVASVFTVMSITGGILAVLGLDQTCRQFESIADTSCSSMFSTGFFEQGMISVLYQRSLSIVIASISSIWVMALAWLSYAIIEFNAWRTDRIRWW